MTRLGGRYEIREELTSQPPVRRFRAYDVVSGQDVFIKTLQASEEQLEAFVRLQEDAALVTALDHPNIYKVYRAFIDNGMTCVVAEAVDGPSLGDILQRERLTLPRIKAIALQIASGLAYGHDRHIVHRDLEPENIVVLPGDRIKIRAIADIGKGRVVRGAARPTPVTSARASIYASPEQRSGRTVSARTDLYSLAALMFHMVTGQPPSAVIEDRRVEFPPDVPREWQALIARGMARSERYRFTDAREMGEAIAALPAPGAPPMRFEAPVRARRCQTCGREVRGRFCTACGTPMPG